MRRQLHGSTVRSHATTDRRNGPLSSQLMQHLMKATHETNGAVVIGTTQDIQKLVFTKARRQISAPRDLPENVADRTQHFIAGNCTVSRVEPREVVDIEENDSQ